MKRLLALAALLTSAVVFADWYGVSVPGMPNDANIISTANGHVVISTTDGVFEVRDGGIIQEMIRGANVAWGTVDGGCLVAYTVKSYRHVCSDAGTFLFNGTNGLDEIRRVAEVGGLRYLGGRDNATTAGVWLEETNGTVNRVSTGTLQQPFWSAAAGNFPRLATYTQGPAHHLIAGGLFNSLLAHAVDGGFDEDRGAPAGGIGVSTVNAELAVFQEGLGFRLLIANFDGGSNVIASKALPLDAGVAERFSTPAGIDRVNSVAFDSTTNPTNTFADGFGMATGRTTAGGGQILQPIPELTNPARSWVANTNQSAITGPFTRVTCVDGFTCVVLTGRDAGDNVYVYENAHAPQFSAPTSASLSAGQTIVIDLSVVDLDGDPMIYDAGSSFSVGDAGALVLLDAGVYEFTAGLTCGAQRTLTFSAEASDGVYNTAHTFTATLPAPSPEQPVVSTALLQLQAGNDAGRVSVSASDGGSCPATEIVWTQTAGGASPFASIVDAGDSKIFVPPTYFCSATPAELEYSITSVNGSTSSPPQTVVVHLDPWGYPDRPFSSDLTINLDAGQEITLTRDGGHFCGDPAFDTIWTVPQVDGGIRINGTPLNSGFPVSNQSLTISTADCVTAAFDIPVRNQTKAPTQLSAAPDPVVHVNVTANLAVSAVSFSSLLPTEFDGGLLVTAATDFVCAGAIGLSAAVTVTRSGQPVADGGLNFTPSQGSVFFPLPDCAGGTFDVTARLINADGGISNVIATNSTTVQPGVIPPPTVIVEDTAVSCASGGSATVSIVTKPRCTGLRYAWQAVSGLPVEISDGGDSISLRTTSTQLGEILGQSVGLQVTPASGSRTFPSTLQQVTFGIQPFVTVDHATDAPVASDTELFGINVTLTNTQPCEVSNVDYVETLTDTRVVPASVRVNGAPVDSERIVIGSKTMAIKGLTLPPGQPVHLYYSARPVLFGAPKPEGKAVLRFGEASEYEISEPSGFARAAGTNPPGCGCNAGSGGAFALFALLTLVRRRRRMSHS